MPKPRTLRVYPNPYCFLDHKGRPQGTFDADPVQHDPNAVKIGVKKITAKPIAIRSAQKGDDRPSIHDVVVEYSDEVQELPDGDDDVHGPSLHARMGLKQGARTEPIVEKRGDVEVVTGKKIVLPGALVAADEATAKVVGLPFADPIELLAAARANAIARWTADYGEPPAFVTEPEIEAHVPALLRGQKPAPPAPPAPSELPKEMKAPAAPPAKPEPKLDPKPAPAALPAAEGK